MSGKSFFCQYLHTDIKVVIQRTRLLVRSDRRLLVHEHDLCTMQHKQAVAFKMEAIFRPT